MVWLELVMFSAAAVVYLLFTGGLRARPAKGKEETASPKRAPKPNAPRGLVEAWLQNATAVPTLQVLSAMKTLGWDTGAVLDALRTALSGHPELRSTSAINELVAELARRGDRDLLDGVLELLPGLQVQPDPRSYEVLLEAHYCLENFHEVKSLSARLRQAGTPLSPRMLTTCALAALRTGQVSDLRMAVGDMKGGAPVAWGAHTAELLLLGARHRCLHALMAETGVAPQLTPERLQEALQQAADLRDPGVCAELSRAALSRATDLGTSAGAWLALARAAGAVGAADLAKVVDACAAQGALSKPTVLALLALCGSLHEPRIASKVVSRTLAQDRRQASAPVFAAAVKVFMQCEQYDLACDLYEAEVAGSGVPLDSQLCGALVTCAEHAGRAAVSAQLLAATPSDVAKHVAMIRARSRENDLAGAVALFEKLQAGGAQLTTLAYNALLDACVQGGKVAVAEKHFRAMQARGLVDVVSYNTLLKAYLKLGDIAEARALVTDMGRHGITANQITYNEMLNALVEAKDRKGTWALIGDMASRGLRPTSVTASILLKALGAASAPADVQRTLDLADEVGDMDEVLFASLIEACVRVGQLDLLSTKLEQYQAAGGLAAITAPTYGSMIKAYGRARDLGRVRSLWAEMRRRGVTPTAITVGCMVDALVSNQQAVEAHALVEELRGDAQCAGTLNTVIYSTLLKGFTLARQPERVQKVYEEMRAHGIACNVVTYNTILDAHARTGRMDVAETVFQGMRADGAEPDVITYSTLVKGYCNAGDLDRGIAVLRSMAPLEPDEIVFNSLLDGCAKQQRVDDALALVDEMHRAHVQPSNYTLSILVKLLGRTRRLNQAFALVEETCRKFDLKANVHVFTCLFQACVQNRQLARALALHDAMITEAGVDPDMKTYSTLLRGCLAAGCLEKATQVVRAAYGLSPQGLVAAPRSPGVEAPVLAEVLAALRAGAEHLATPLLADLQGAKVACDGVPRAEPRVEARALPQGRSKPRRTNPGPCPRVK